MSSQPPTSTNTAVSTTPLVIRSSQFQVEFCFKNSTRKLVYYNENAVASFEQVAHNEYQMILSLTEDNADNLLSLNTHGKDISIITMGLFNTNTQRSFTLIQDKVLTIVDAKMSRLGEKSFVSTPVTLTLHLFDYN